MKIKVTTKNIEKIHNTIDDEEGQATARLAYFGDLERLVQKAEQVLQYLPKKDWIGFQAAYAMPCTYSRASYGFPMSTSVTIERFKSGWFLTVVCREASPERKAYAYSIAKMPEIFNNEIVIKMFDNLIK